jgi:hypothetical protein
MEKSYLDTFLSFFSFNSYLFLICGSMLEGIILSNILWHMDSLLGNDRETSNDKTAVVMQGPAYNNGSAVGGGVFYVVRSEPVSRDRPSECHSVESREGK